MSLVNRPIEKICLKCDEIHPHRMMETGYLQCQACGSVLEVLEPRANEFARHTAAKNKVRPTRIGKHMTAKAIGMAPREVFTIHNKRGGTLGHVEWHATWREYVFSPENDTLFSHDCVMAMAHFLDSVKDHENG